MKIFSWNTNGIRSTHKSELLLSHFDEGYDILCFQETKSEPEQLPDEIKNVPGYHSYFSYSKVRRGYSGVAIYTKVEPLSVRIGFGSDKIDPEGRSLVAEYETFFLINCYFPNGGGAPERLEYKLDFYKKFLIYIEKLKKDHPKKTIIVCGDVNVAHNPIDLARPKENETHVGFLPIERAWMDKVIKAGWSDVWRTLHGEEVAYTYWDQKSFARKRNVGWRIDYFITQKESVKHVKHCTILPDVMGSDHCPIVLDVRV